MVGPFLALYLLLPPRPGSCQAELRATLARLSGARIKDNDGTLVVRYRTEIVEVPKPSKTFHVKRETVAEERPTLTGFKLETYEFLHKPTEPARAEQAVRVNGDWMRDYGAWKLDWKDVQVVGTDRARYYNLAWGVKADPKLISKIRAILEKGTRPIPQP